MKGFRLTLKGIVRPGWIDNNGHMNIARYLHLFNDASDVLLQESRVMAAGEDLTFVAGRIQMAHRREMLEDEPWEVWSGYTLVDAQHITFAHRLTSAGSIRATCDIGGTAFSRRDRARIPLPDRNIADAQPFVVPGLRSPFAPPSAA